MLYYDRIDVSEGIDINKSSKLKKFNISHNWYFLHTEFKIQVDVWNRYHDVLMMSMNLSVLPVLNINCVDYSSVINRTTKGEAVNLLQNADLNKVNWNIKHNFSLSCIKDG